MQDLSRRSRGFRFTNVFAFDHYDKHDNRIHDEAFWIRRGYMGYCRFYKQMTLKKLIRLYPDVDWTIAEGSPNRNISEIQANDPDRMLVKNGYPPRQGRCVDIEFP